MQFFGGRKLNESGKLTKQKRRKKYKVEVLPDNSTFFLAIRLLSFSLVYTFSLNYGSCFFYEKYELNSNFLSLFFFRLRFVTPVCRENYTINSFLAAFFVQILPVVSARFE